MYKLAVKRGEKNVKVHIPRGTNIKLERTILQQSTQQNWPHLFIEISARTVSTDFTIQLPTFEKFSRIV